MSGNDLYPMTQEGKQKLEQELENLVKVERENLKVAISEARAHGDLKENAEYHSAKEKQSLIEGRIGELQHKLGKVQVVDISNIKSETIVFGATVTLVDLEKDKTVIYQIVGADEANTKEGKISYTSPLAQALLGKKEQDEVVVKAPKGDIEYEIQEVRYI